MLSRILSHCLGKNTRIGLQKIQIRSPLCRPGLLHLRESFSRFIKTPIKTRSFYTQSRHSHRGSQYSFLDSLPPSFFIRGIIGLNTLVFGAWYMAIELARSKGDTNLLVWMNQNFVSGVPSVLGLGHYWTLLTAAFSHQTIWHFGVNMFVLHSFGSAIVSIIGNRQFLPFYLGTALISSLASLGYQLTSWSAAAKNPYGREARQQLSHGSVGASGAISGATTVYALCFPKELFYIFGVIPVPAALAVGGFIAWDAMRTYSGSQGRTDTMGHIGGAAAGALYWFLYLKGRRF